MTNATAPVPPQLLRPPLSTPPLDIWQLWLILWGYLNQRDPHRCEKLMADASKENAQRVLKRWEQMIKAMGLREGPPEYRRESYNMKTAREAVDSLWHSQMQEFPDKFAKRVVDAYELGARLPPWCEMIAIQLGARIDD